MARFEWEIDSAHQCFPAREWRRLARHVQAHLNTREQSCRRWPSQRDEEQRQKLSPKVLENPKLFLKEWRWVLTNCKRIRLLWRIDPASSWSDPPTLANEPSCPVGFPFSCPDSISVINWLSVMFKTSNCSIFNKIFQLHLLGFTISFRYVRFVFVFWPVSLIESSHIRFSIVISRR